MRILILRLGAIGDSLLAFPLLRALRTHIIDAHITFVSNPAILQLALDYGIADEVSDCGDPLWSQLFLESSREGWRDGRGPLWSSVREQTRLGNGQPQGSPPHPRPTPVPTVRERLRERLHHTECAICWLTDVDGIVERSLQAEGVQHIIIAPGRPPIGERMHIVDYLARTIEPILASVGAGEDGGWGWDPWVALLREEHKKQINRGPHRATQGSPPHSSSSPAPTDIPIAIHPGSGGAHKCWPVTSFATTVQCLWQRNIPVVLLAGPADAARTQELLAHLSQPTQPTLLAILFNAPLTEVAQQLRRCRGYLGNDAGITHLAAMLGIPTLALFGPSDPAVWHPIGPRVQVLHEPNLQDLAVDRVMQAIDAFILP